MFTREQNATFGQSETTHLVGGFLRVTTTRQKKQRHEFASSTVGMRRLRLSHNCWRLAKHLLRLGWDKSLQLEKTDVALRMARAAITAAKEHGRLEKLEEA